MAAPLTHLSTSSAPRVQREMRAAPAALETLRAAAQTARLQPSRDDGIAGLLQSLSRVIGKRLVLFEPGAADMSFDEKWLLNLIASVQAGDKDRYCFALLSRMSKADAADVHFSVCKASWTLDVSV